MASAGGLLGASFDGELAPPGVAPSPISYCFEAEPLEAGMPPAVLKQRRALGWTCKDVVCVKAVCNIPALGIKTEEVVVSVEQPAADGACRLMLQSLTQPDLGLTVLSLDKDGSSLVGGDETWVASEPPIIRAQRRAKEEPATPALEAKPPTEPRLAEKGYPTRRPVAAAVSAPVAPRGREVQLEEEPLPRTPSPSRTPSPARVPIEGGVGNQRTGGPRRLLPRQPKVGADSFLRPDIAIGTDVEVPKPIKGDELDSEIRAAEAEAAERLVAAAAAGDTGQLRKLLVRTGPRVVAPSGPHTGLTALMAAVARGRTEAAALLIEQRADLVARDPQGWTAVMHAVYEQRQDTLQRLLESKAAAAGGGQCDTETGATPLMLAAGGARSELCAVLLQRGHPSSMLATIDYEGRTAVHYAARNGRCGSLVLLLKARARIDVRGEDGCGPLLEAARAGRAECVRFLLSHKANPKAQDSEGRTAATLAKIYGHERALQALTETKEIPAWLRD